MPFDLEKLFEPRKPPKPLYPSVRAELDAIAAGKKQVSMFGVTPQHMVALDSYYFEILELAFERGLVVVLHSDPLPRSELPHPRVFVTRPDQLWRVPALLAVDEAFVTTRFDERSWLALTLQTSVLLGYTPAQCKAWVAEQRQREEGVYVLLTREQKQRVLAHGRRCFGAPADLEGMCFFVHRAGRLNPRARVPRSLTLARAPLRADTWAALFPDWNRRRGNYLFSTSVSVAQAQALNDGLCGRIDFLTARGWR